MKRALIKVNTAPLTKRYIFRRWVIRLTWALAFMAPLIFLIAAIGAKIGLWSWRFGLGTLTMKVGPALLLMTLVFGVITLILAFIIKPRRGLVAGLVAILVGVIGLASLKSMKNKAASLPFIHDVTTNTQDPPRFTAVIMDERAKVPNVNSVEYIGKRDARRGELVSVLQAQAYPGVRTIIRSEPPEQIYGEVRAIARNLGWEIVNEDPEKGILEATDTTFWYGFQDDVIIRVRAGEGGGSVVDARSVSRVGGSDLGKNAERLSAFIKAME